MSPSRLETRSRPAVPAPAPPRGVPHAWKTTGAETVRVLFLYTPAKAGRLIEERQRTGRKFASMSEGELADILAVKWTRLSCRIVAANAVRFQLHVLAYNLGNFMWTLALPEAAEAWSLTSLREKLSKIGAKVVRHGRYLSFLMAKVAVSRQMFAESCP
jgi:hypothetical protein